MKLGIVGPAMAGKSTLTTLLCGEAPGADALAGRAQTKLVRVPDARLEHLREVFQPRSFKPATFTVTDFGQATSKDQRLGEERNADAFLVCLPAFDGASPKRALADLEADWILTDQQTAERRIDKIEGRIKRPIPQREKDELEVELTLMRRVFACLEQERSLSTLELEDRDRAMLKPFGFLSIKPRLLIVNVGEDALPYDAKALEPLGLGDALPVCAKLEAELTLMDSEERAIFQGEYEITEMARDRLVRAAYDLLGLHSFFTYGADEVRAWTVTRGATAWESSGEIHSDIQRGFIRAEVLAFDDFKACGSSEKRAKAEHKLRLEGKDYVIRDADMVEFRFSV